MITFKKLTHQDYDDILDISKDIWEGSDYLPRLFHKWVDSEGYFLGAVDPDKNKVIGVAKFSILYDKSGWLEGLRVHTDYRGQKIGRLLSEKLLEIAKENLKKGKINKIAFATYIDSIESITLMKKLGFKLEYAEYMFHKEYENLDSKLSLEDFKVKPWDLNFEEFLNLPCIKNRNNLFNIAFVLQEPTIELYNELKAEGAFVTINNFNGIFKLKGEPNFLLEEDNFEAINTFMNYYLLKYRNSGFEVPCTTITKESSHLINKLKKEGYESWSDWQLDYFYFVYKSMLN